jgi:hypothetical protein
VTLISRGFSINSFRLTICPLARHLATVLLEEEEQEDE